MYDMESWSKDGVFNAEPGQEISKEIYDQMLNTLPPKTVPAETLKRYGLNCRGGFLMGEPYKSDIEGYSLYLAFGQTDTGYYYLGLSRRI